MLYSCAVWPDSIGGAHGDVTFGPSQTDLETAQSNKIAVVLKRARAQPGHRILEFGSGWGGFAIAAARAGCTVDTITLSLKQKEMADIRIAEADLTGKITTHLLDYRDLPDSFKGLFDAFVALEMVEASVEFL